MCVGGGGVLVGNLDPTVFQRYKGHVYYRTYIPVQIGRRVHIPIS